ncbi:MerR family transcriptional regulator [Nonomuraea sp. MCN248]|uniref:MerR family transcriptional regulator n=1 Tax=Nonomuraea corallina TaxID=2989783 RepID=A0ABT4SE76_9ACTN|nr:MerR family transcriptional regulator [Nonomuraea corallina]MDA0635502.1 MerR family transcriptional regulator [Nonomuraea corallina]
MTRAARLRPSDLAREHGLSAQAVRNYEDDGILPPAPRDGHGYRQYTPVHAQALRAFLTLRPGFGHQGAAAILRAANAGDEEAVLRLVERGHADMLRDRATLDEAAAALAALAPVPGDDRPVRGAPSVGALAHQLGIHPATLRTWERAGILRAERDPATGYRRYPPAAVRDAHLARQLRRGGYPLSQIAAAVARVREAGGVGPLEEALDAWRSRLRLRGRAMLDGTAELSTYLRLRGL